MKEKSKVMAKWQTVIPKEVREAASIRVGDMIKWRYELGKIIVIPPTKIPNPSESLYGLIPSDEDAVEEVKRMRNERLEKSLH